MSKSRSNASLRPSPNLSNTPLHPLEGEDDDGGPPQKFSLAHELAAALMPEPSAGSKLLAEEFGIEFDEGAEGIEEDDESHVDADKSSEVEDDTIHGHSLLPSHPNGIIKENGTGTSLRSDDASSTSDSNILDSTLVDSSFEDPPAEQQSLLTLLSEDVSSTDLFLRQLRRLDTEPSSSLVSLTTYPGSIHEPPVERIASHIIRKINDTAREREGQVRELREYEKEFRKIGGEVGGIDVLGELDELEEVEGLLDEVAPLPVKKDEEEEGGKGGRRPAWQRARRTASLGGIEEEQEEEDPDDFPLDDSEALEPPPKEDEPLPPSFPATPTTALKHLSSFRLLTTTFVHSLSTISEHAQVNGAATAEAGRKLRALKNRIGGWKADWESAERSRERIEGWQREEEELSGKGVKIDFGKMMRDEMMAFEKVLNEAGRKAAAIIAAS
jgi:hypothetical protein